MNIKDKKDIKGINLFSPMEKLGQQKIYSKHSFVLLGVAVLANQLLNCSSLSLRFSSPGPFVTCQLLLKETLHLPMTQALREWTPSQQHETPALGLLCILTSHCLRHMHGNMKISPKTACKASLPMDAWSWLKQNKDIFIYSQMKRIYQ